MADVPKQVEVWLAGKAREFKRPVVNLPTWRNAKVKFQAASDWAPIEEDMDMDRSTYPALVPIGNIENASEFLVVDTSNAQLPVLMYDHEVRKFVSGFDSFDAFVAAVREG